MAISKQLFQIAKNDIVGRYLIANENISAGEIIFCENPIMLGPKRFSLPICLGCHHSVDGSYFCTKCGFPMCSSDCQNTLIHSENECKIFGNKSSKPKKFSDYNKSLQPLYQCILPLRLLMLKHSDSIKWKKLNELEHHTELRKIVDSGDNWHMNSVNIVQFLRNWCGMNEFDEETIHRVIGYIDVNSFHVKTINNIEIAGIYENGSIPSQDCVPNTHHAFTKNCQLIFRSSIPILKGQSITMSYAPLLNGTLDRRQCLRTTKYFECICQRCKDPTEGLTYVSAHKCLHCPNGYLLPEKPLEINSSWNCYNDIDGSKNEQCQNFNTIDKILFNLNEMKNAINAISSAPDCSIQSLETLLNIYSGIFLHPNHFLLIPILKELNRLYTLELEICTTKSVQSSKIIFRRNEVVQKLLNISNHLEPGLTRARGVLLYQIYLSQHELAKQKFETNEITKDIYEIEKKNIMNGLKITEQIFELDKMIGVTNLRNFNIT